MLKKSFNSSSLLFERISLPLLSLYCFIFFIDQIQFGETLITPGFHIITMFVYAVTFNMLKGLKTLAGMMVFIYAVLSVGSFSLICLISRSSMSELVDVQHDFLMLNLSASAIIFVASYIFTKINFGDPIISKFLPIINQKENIPKALPALFTLTAFATIANFLELPGETAKFLDVLSPLMFLVGWAIYRQKAYRNHVLACYVIVIGVIWSSAGLSGMKSSLLLPLVGMGGAAAMAGVQFKKIALFGFAAFLIFVSVIATAIQPLRNIKVQTTKEFRLKLALAYIVFDLGNRYDLKIDINDRDLEGIINRLAYENKDAKKVSSAGILTRMSYFEDDSKLTEAVRVKGELPLEKFFEDIVLVPRVISGRTFVTDKLSAFYGRYAEIIGRFNNTTGIAFSGHVISYAHGGFIFMMTSMFISVLFIFILVSSVFGKTIQQNDLASLFALVYITTSDHAMSIQSLWNMLFRGIPVIISAYIALYFATQLIIEISDGSRQAGANSKQNT